MLALTENVTDIVKQQAADEVPEITALRIATEADGESLSVSPADHAESDDQVIEQDGATIYVDGPASEPSPTRCWTAAWTRTAPSSSRWASRPDPRTTDTHGRSPGPMGVRDSAHVRAPTACVRRSVAALPALANVTASAR